MSSDGELSEREKSVYYAKLAEQAERYDEMAAHMRSVAVSATDELSVEERNLLSVAYKNSVGARRASWRILASVESKQKAKGNLANAHIANAYRLHIEEELMKICNEILDLLNRCLVTENSNAEAKVFCYKMQGDYYRYTSEFLSDKQREQPVINALAAYNKATEIAQQELSCTHPIRLGLALNFSVFYYEIMNEPSTACNMAQEAFDRAIGQLDSLAQDAYRDSTLIMQLLRDNLTLWTADQVATKDGPGGESVGENRPGGETVEAQ